MKVPRRTTLTLMTWGVIIIVVIILSALSVGCSNAFVEAREAREAESKKKTGNEDLEVVEFDHKGKHYIVLLWHNSYGSDMEVLEVRDVEVRSDAHTD